MPKMSMGLVHWASNLWSHFHHPFILVGSARQGRSHSCAAFVLLPGCMAFTCYIMLQYGMVMYSAMPSAGEPARSSSVARARPAACGARAGANSCHAYASSAGSYPRAAHGPACANTIGGYGCGGTCARRAGAGTGGVAPLRFTAHAFGHAGFISQMRGGRLERVTLEGTLTASPGLITASAG